MKNTCWKSLFLSKYSFLSKIKINKQTTRREVLEMDKNKKYSTYRLKYNNDCLIILKIKL